MDPNSAGFFDPQPFYCPNSRWLVTSRLDMTRHVRQIEPIHFGCVELVEPRLRNDLYCVEWGVKLYSLTHSRLSNSMARHARLDTLDASNVLSRVET